MILSLGGGAPGENDDIPPSLDSRDKRANDLSDSPFDPVSADSVSSGSSGGNPKPCDRQRVWLNDQHNKRVGK